MNDLNKTMLIGRLGQEPELRHSQNGDPVLNMSMATGDKWKDKQGNPQEKTEWHRLVAFGKLAELCHQFLSKGSQIYAEGKLQTRSYDDKEGIKRYSTEIVLKEVQFLDKKADGNNQNKNGYQNNNQGHVQNKNPQSTITKIC